LSEWKCDEETGQQGERWQGIVVNAQQLLAHLTCILLTATQCRNMVRETGFNQTTFWRGDRAQDIFLKINGIEGESQDASHKGEIEVLSWNWGMTQTSNMHAGSGGGAGKATVRDLTFLHWTDRASPTLIKHCLTGKHIPEARLTVRKAGGKPLEYLRIIMTDVIVSEVRATGESARERIRETVSLAFSKVSHEYVVQKPTGRQRRHSDRQFRHQGKQGVLTLWVASTSKGVHHG
jgi:type VI secretion system secreted protein Hcp